MKYSFHVGLVVWSTGGMLVPRYFSNLTKLTHYEVKYKKEWFKFCLHYFITNIIITLALHTTIKIIKAYCFFLFFVFFTTL